LLLLLVGCKEQSGEALKTIQTKASVPTTAVNLSRPQANATPSLPVNNTPVLNISVPRVNYTARPINYAANTTGNTTNVTARVNVTAVSRANYTFIRLNTTGNTS
jgi:hypothetical protein